VSTPDRADRAGSHEDGEREMDEADGAQQAGAAAGGRACGDSRRKEPVRAVLFDRDDTLIHNVPYLDDPEGVRPVAGARDLLDRLRARGIAVGVVSNQSGVARGLITPDQLARVNARVETELGPFDTWQVCPHGEQDRCGCRKPAPGLVLAAAAALGLEPAECLMVGDIGADVEAGLGAGARAVLVPTPVTRPEEVERARTTAAVAGSLEEAVSLHLAGLR
jgi:D-glycero-D-manno-heptose 1,7-bisphosphate phosphatase